jgi:serine/threonine-protein kinase
VVLADDSVLFRTGLARIVADAGLQVAGQAGTAEELLALVRETSPDVAVVDIRMPPTQTIEGLAAAGQIRRENPGVGVLLLSHFIETQHVMMLLENGADGLGYLLKDRVADIDDFCDAVRAVGAGRSAIDPEVVSRLVANRRSRDVLSDLTDRERDVLALMAEGRSNLAIGQRLFLSSKTVEAHVRNIFGKLMLEPAPDDHRRILAVLAYLRS